MKKICILVMLCLALVLFAACTSSGDTGTVVTAGVTSAPSTDATTDAPVTDAPPVEVKEYLRVGFLYPYADSWRFDISYYRVGDVPAEPKAHASDKYFMGWESGGSIVEISALEAAGELTSLGEAQSRVGGYSELLALCSECNYAYVAKYQYPATVKVGVIGADGKTYESEVAFGQKLPASLFENAYLPALPAGERVEVTGWLYSLDGKEWLTYNAEMRATEPIFIKPDVKHYCLLTLNAGKGVFDSGSKLEKWFEKGTTVSVALLETPHRNADGDKVYVFSGYLNSQGHSVTEVTMSSAVTLKASYEVSEKVYTVTVITERGSLPGGGKSATFILGYEGALEVVKKHQSNDYGVVEESGEFYEVADIEIFQNDTVWTVIVKWRNAATYTLLFEYEGECLFTQTVHKGETLKLPTHTYEDAVGYYIVLGWLDEAGVLHSVGEEMSVSSDIRFTASWELSSKKEYTVVFKTDKGTFADGSTSVTVSGYYGDALLPPEPPEVQTLTYGSVVFTFAGWGDEVPATFCENAEYSAVYTTDQPVYYLTYRIDGEIYSVVPYYADSEVTLIAPTEIDGVMFSGWQCDDESVDISGGSFLMPAADTELYGSFERAEFDVYYYVDGVLTYTDTHLAGTEVTLRPLEVKEGHTFSYVAGVEITDGKFTMPAENVRIDGEFSPNVHKIIFLDSESGSVIFSDDIEYGSEFCVSEIEFYREGEYTSAWVCIQGLPNDYGEDIVMPDSDLVFVATWSPVLTVGLDGVWLPYYGGEGDADFNGFYFDEAAGVLYIYDAALTVAGATEGVSVVYDIKTEI